VTGHTPASINRHRARDKLCKVEHYVFFHLISSYRLQAFNYKFRIGLYSAFTAVAEL